MDLHYIFCPEKSVVAFAIITLYHGEKKFEWPGNGMSCIVSRSDTFRMKDKQIFVNGIRFMTAVI